MLIGEETFLNLTATAWTAIGTITLAGVAGVALIMNARATRHMGEQVAVQMQSLDHGLSITTWSGSDYPVELLKDR